jgi:hypothetical protein
MVAAVADYKGNGNRWDAIGYVTERMGVPSTAEGLWWGLIQNAGSLSSAFRQAGCKGCGATSSSG